MESRRAKYCPELGATECNIFELENASAEGPELVYSPELVAGYLEPTDLLALHLGAANPKWAERINLIRKIPLK